MNVEDRIKRTLKTMRENNVIDRDKYNEYVQAITCWVEYIQRLEKENEEQKKKISELESKLSVKENEDCTIELFHRIKSAEKYAESLENQIDSLVEEKENLKNRISELESELSVKENLLKIKNGLCGEEIPKEVTVDGFKCEIIQTAQGLYIDQDRIYEIIEREKEPLKKELERKENIINQIDYILNSIFGVTHDATNEPSEFEKILREKAENYKNTFGFLPAEPICVADMLIRAKRSYECDERQKELTGMDIAYYHIFDVSELRQIAEHLLVYCNHNSEEVEKE